MAACEQGDEQLLDDFLLADDDFGQFGLDCARGVDDCPDGCLSVAMGSGVVS